LQVHLNDLANKRSKDRVLQIKAYMQAIFAEAVDQDFLAKDPARNVKAPVNLKDTDKTTLSWQQLKAALSKLSLKERLILELDMTNALRPALALLQLLGEGQQPRIEGDGLSRRDSSVGKNQDLTVDDSHCEKIGRRPLVVEAGVPELITRSVHLCEERKRRIHGCRKLPQTGCRPQKPRRNIF